MVYIIVTGKWTGTNVATVRQIQRAQNLYLSGRLFADIIISAGCVGQNIFAV